MPGAVSARGVAISASLFERLLSAVDTTDAVHTLRGFWAHRLVGGAPSSGVSAPEYAVQLTLIYTGEVNNGGHVQYFLNRKMRHLHDTIAALRDVGLGEMSSVLEVAAVAYGDDDADMARFDAEMGALDRRTPSVLLAYCRANRARILKPERAVQTLRASGL